MSMIMKRRLGKSNIEVSAIGLGCWAIGGPWSDMLRGGKPAGWGQIDDQESIRAIHVALEQGVTLFDTANNYGCGHSEQILGQALGHRRPDVVIATKFGYTFDESTKQMTGSDASPAQIRDACEQSLRRLKTDYIDLYQFHIANFDLEQSVEVREVLEELVSEGKIRWYGWSTNNLQRARVFAEGSHCTAIQHHFNVLEGNPAMVALCEEFDIASICRGPLLMGLLTGKFTASSHFPNDDVRNEWNFKDGEENELLHKLSQVRNILINDGRTMPQAALAWLWSHSDHNIPIPGFKTVQQVQENMGALSWGPLGKEQMQQIQTILNAA